MYIYTMASSRRVMARTLITNSSPELKRQRRKDLEKIDNPLKRLAALMLHGAALACPEMAARYAGVDLDAVQRSEWIGMGYDSVVAKMPPDGVAKIHLATLCMDRASQRHFAEQKATEHEKLAAVMGEFCLPQSVDVDFFPGSTGHEAVQTHQPYRTLANLGIFTPRAETLATSTPRALRTLQQTYPEAAEQLPAFVGCSLALYNKTGLLPDATGLGNVSIDAITGDIVLIDAYPLPMTSQEVMRQTFGQLQELDNLLREAA